MQIWRWQACTINIEAVLCMKCLGAWDVGFSQTLVVILLVASGLGHVFGTIKRDGGVGLALAKDLLATGQMQVV